MELFTKIAPELKLNERVRQLLGQSPHLAYKDPNSDLRVGIIKEESKIRIIINNQEIASSENKSWKIRHADYNLSEILEVLDQVPTPKHQLIHKKPRVPSNYQGQTVNLADECFTRGLSGLL